ncbi:MAG: winged helix-turn-helix transcriptional regulator [Sedimentisphaerales bacterium]|nr:winged helix-turn-helix transcriptional regulator [Sedimentisphaerales bacterium]MBN2842780.1 winged helix-turn-helix transcriptional regulator [Sedimentisphaerales bacterium]
MILDKLKALSDLNRLRIVCALQGGELCACQLIELLGIAGATVSRHVKQLVDAGLVNSRKEGKWVYYSLVRGNADDCLVDHIYQQARNDRIVISDIKRLIAIRKCDKNILCNKMGN